MRTVRTKVYKFNELNETAKLKAIEWYRDNVQAHDYYWGEDYMSTIKAACKSFDFELKDWNIDFDNAARCSWKIETNLSAMLDHAYDCENPLTGIRLRTYLLNNYYHLFFEGKPYGECQKDKNGNWFYPRRSMVIFQETNCPFTGVCTDEDFLDTFRAFIKKPDNSNLEELMNDAIHSVCKALESESDSRREDDYISEELGNNEFEFTKDGKQFNQ